MQLRLKIGNHNRGAAQRPPQRLCPARLGSARLGSAPPPARAALCWARPRQPLTFVGRGGAARRGGSAARPLPAPRSAPAPRAHSRPRGRGRAPPPAAGGPRDVSARRGLPRVLAPPPRGGREGGVRNGGAPRGAERGRGGAEAPSAAVRREREGKGTGQAERLARSAAVRSSGSQPIVLVPFYYFCFRAIA